MAERASKRDADTAALNYNPCTCYGTADLECVDGVVNVDVSARCALDHTISGCSGQCGAAINSAHVGRGHGGVINRVDGDGTFVRSQQNAATAHVTAVTGHHGQDDIAVEVVGRREARGRDAGQIRVNVGLVACQRQACGTRARDGDGVASQCCCYQRTGTDRDTEGDCHRAGG